ncbi:amino acid permease, partial [Klebsiella pneumoniae]
GLFTLLNLLGIDIFARLQSALALLMMIVLLVLGLGAVSSDHASAQTALASGWNPLGVSALALTAMAVWGFVGAEFVCPLVEETRRPERNIPRSMILGLSIIFLTIALYCFGALLCIPQAELAGDPLPHFLFANR